MCNVCDKSRDKPVVVKLSYSVAEILVIVLDKQGYYNSCDSDFDKENESFFKRRVFLCILRRSYLRLFCLLFLTSGIESAVVS